jgi:ComF family protein
MRNEWKMRLAGLLFGGSCFLCRGAAKDLLCPECDADLPRLDMPLCPRCALPSPGAATCGRCLTEKPAYDATRAALAYDFPADALVHALKFRGELALAPLLGALLKGAVGEDRADCIVPVPLSPSRLRERGYNQAVEIARQLGRPGLDVSLCERTRESRPQMELPYDERQRNVRGVFHCTRALVGARVAVVDDVMTTGATLDELARTLKAAGAVHVSNWVVTRAL